MVSYRAGQPNWPEEPVYPPMSGGRPPRGPAPSRSRTKWLIAIGGIVVTLSSSAGIAGTVAAVRTHHTAAPAPVISETAALQQWWSHAQDDFVDLQNASGEVQQALSRFKLGALEPACQHVHDAAEVRLESQLPTPNAELTAELRAAIEDFHAAAHMCLAIAAGSLNNYAGEFLASMAEANAHLRAAHGIIQKMLTVI